MDYAAYNHHQQNLILQHTIHKILQDALHSLGTKAVGDLNQCIHQMARKVSDDTLNGLLSENALRDTIRALIDTQQQQAELSSRGIHNEIRASLLTFQDVFEEIQRDCQIIKHELNTVRKDIRDIFEHHRLPADAASIEANGASLDRVLKEIRELHSVMAKSQAPIPNPNPQPPRRKQGASTRRAATVTNPKTGRRKYCYCEKTAYGLMVACDGGCTREWFHLRCTGLKAAPRSNGKLHVIDLASLFADIMISSEVVLQILQGLVWFGLTQLFHAIGQVSYPQRAKLLVQGFDTVRE